jgi:DNA-binding NarL/FixJ family response regulator
MELISNTTDFVKQDISQNTEHIHQTVVTYISNTDVYDSNIMDELQRRVGFKYQQLKSLHELFSLLTDSSFYTDLILFDLPTLYGDISESNDNEASIFNIFNTISVLTKTKSLNHNLARPIKKYSTLGVIIDINTNEKKLKILYGTDIRGIYPSGSEFTIDEKEEALRELLSDNYFMPKKIIARLKTPKKRKPNQEINLTPRQEQVVKLISGRGATNKVIAKMLNISESTVKIHITAIFKKYGVTNRTQLALIDK